MDIQLPGMDGITAIKTIREDPDINHIPIIALTAHVMPGNDKKALEAGCDEYICKPIDTQRFLKKVSKILRRRQHNRNFFEKKKSRDSKTEF